MRTKTDWSLRVVTVLSLGACLCAATVSRAQQAGSVAASQRLPGYANAMMTVEVAKLLASPLGREQGWQSKMISGYADRPLAVPATAKRVTVAAGVHPAGMKAIWQSAIVELPHPPRFDMILRAQGGYLDQITGKKVAWTPRDVFYVELAENTLGVVRPGQRQYVTRWLGGTGQAGWSPYLKSAQAAVSDADVLFALDLDEIVGVTAIRYASGMGQLPSLEKLEGEKLIGALAGVKGLRIVVRVSDRINAELVADFEQSVAALGDQAKPFVIDVLTLCDLYEPTIEQWQFKADGKTIVGQGTMQPEALNRLMMLLSPAGVAHEAVSAPAAASSSPPPAPGPGADPKADAARASQQYYKAVAVVLDTMTGKSSPAQSATWLVSKARVIEQLPLLNVDPALVEWGNSVVDAINRAAAELGIGQQKATVASLGVASPTAYAQYSDTGGSTSDNAETRAAYRNAQLQRRQVSQSERSAAVERALAILNDILPTRGKIRAEMVQKYGVEF